MKKLCIYLLTTLLLISSISISVYAKTCVICGGARTVECSYCHGTGEATLANVAPSEMIENADCPRCGGAKRVKCMVCNGTGETPDGGSNSGGSNSSGNNTGTSGNDSVATTVIPGKTYEIKQGDRIKMCSGALDAIPGTHRWQESDSCVTIGTDVGGSGSGTIYITGNKPGTSTITHTYTYNGSSRARDGSYVFYIKVTEGNSSSKEESSAPESESSAPSDTKPPALSSKAAFGLKNGNLINGGQVAESGDWVYYSKNNRLERVNKDGTVQLIAKSGASFISVVGDWIYYKNGDDDYKLYKIKSDGTGKKKISDDECFNPYVSDGWVYYKNGSDDYKLYKIKADGTGKTKICDDQTGALMAVGEWIYYVNVSDKNSLYIIKTNGTSKVKLCSDLMDSLYVVYTSDWVYYINVSDGRKLYRISRDGKNKAKILDSVGFFNVYGDWIYYTISKDGLYKVKVDGTGKKKILNEKSITGFYLTTDKLYYSSNSELKSINMQ